MGDTEFKHITVTAADDDDFVIRAGVGQDVSSAKEAEPAAEPAIEAQVEPAVEPEPAIEPEPVPDPDSTPPASPASEAAPAPAPAAKPRLASKNERADRETTLEDLETGPMPLAQKIVIIAAIVCIIGAVIYYFAFLR